MEVELAAIASAPTSLAPGSRLGRYQIIRRLQKGGMAELYLARQLAEGGYEKIVAVKRVLPHLAEDAAFVRMFLNEARLAAGLDHSNIAHVLDFGSEGPEHYLVLEYVHGRSVLEVLREAGKQGGLPLPCALTIIHEVAAALHYAHDKAGPDGRPLGLVHRDVSPSNVLVSYDGEVKLVDFGIAKATAHTRATQSGTIKGKLAYMAPEQVRGEALDRRADVFSLAVVAYELCTGRRCFVAPGEFALINRVAAGRYEKPSAIRPGFPAPLEQIIARGLAVEVEERFESAQALQLEIERFARQHGFRLSKLELADAMRGLYGHVAYPTTEALPAPSVALASASMSASTTTLVTARDTDDDDEPATRSRRGRATGWLAGVALVIGVAVGVGAPRLLGALDEGGNDGVDRAHVEPQEQAAAAAAAAAAGEHTAAPVGSTATGAEPTAGATSSGGGDSTAVDVVGLEPSDDAQPRESSDIPRRRSGRRKARKAAAGGGTKAALEYLPPSRRSG